MKEEARRRHLAPRTSRVRLLHKLIICAPKIIDMYIKFGTSAPPPPMMLNQAAFIGDVSTIGVASTLPKARNKKPGLYVSIL